MNENILTPISLWSDFDLTLPLKESKINVVPLGIADYNYVYFSGRQTATGRPRIYGLFAKQKVNSKGSMLILPDVCDEIDEDLVHHFVKEGYDVLVVDFAGEREGVKNYTKYPKDVSYANYNECETSFYKAENTAKQTCWYEWTAIGRYAVNFLEENNPKKPIFALGVRYGANVLWQLAGVDKRISAAIFLFGAGWLAYNGIEKRSEVDIEMTDERIRFLAGVEAQSYAKHVTCPVLYLGSTGSDIFNAERAVDTLSYVENQKKVYFDFSASSINVLDGKYLKTVDLFLKKYVNKDKIQLPDQPQLDFEYDNGEIEFEVNYSKPLDIENICIFTSFDEAELSKRVWHKNYINVNEKGKTIFKLPLLNSVSGVISFVKIKYKNGFLSSSRFVYRKIDNKSNVKVPSVIFDTDKHFITFITSGIKGGLLSNVFSENRLYETTVGPSGIKGVTTLNTLTTYAIKKLAPSFTFKSFLKFDVYTIEFLTLTVTLNDGENDYFYTINVTGGEIWQNVNIDLTEFKNSDGLSIEDFTKIITLSFKSVGKYTLNNIMVL